MERLTSHSSNAIYIYMYIVHALIIQVNRTIRLRTGQEAGMLPTNFPLFREQKLRRPLVTLRQQSLQCIYIYIHVYRRHLVTQRLASFCVGHAPALHHHYRPPVPPSQDRRALRLHLVQEVQLQAQQLPPELAQLDLQAQ